MSDSHVCMPVSVCVCDAVWQCCTTSGQASTDPHCCKDNGKVVLVVVHNPLVQPFYYGRFRLQSEEKGGKCEGVSEWGGGKRRRSYLCGLLLTSCGRPAAEKMGIF